MPARSADTGTSAVATAVQKQRHARRRAADQLRQLVHWSNADVQGCSPHRYVDSRRCR
jgi:hypothetical protein